MTLCSHAFDRALCPPPDDQVQSRESLDFDEPRAAKRRLQPVLGGLGKVNEAGGNQIISIGVLKKEITLQVEGDEI